MNKTFFLRAALCAMLLAPIVPITRLSEAQIQGSTGTLNARVIVKYRADAGLPAMHTLSVRDQHALRARSLAQRQGVALRTGKALHERAHVVFADGISSSQLAARLAQDSEVEWAVPDGRKRRAAAPNDARYVTVNGTGPASGQWYLRPNAGEVKSSIDVEPAWAITTGSNTVVIAVLDTGVRFDHPDLQKVANGGNLLDGYDMISDTATANDGGGVDADASDPGDWITAAEANDATGAFYHCTELDATTGRYISEDSSWHGTETTGLIGAITNNTEGIASVGRTVRVLPVRVLGKCGGFDSDIIAGMYWAANLNSVGGSASPPNATPAKVINMSLGGVDSCNAAYRDAVNQITAAGVTIVASAGNSEGHAVNSPANCPGVIAVAGLRHVGSKVGFSDIGPEVSISAPGGNCVNTGLNEPCLYPILTTSNAGLTTPAGATYSDSFKISIGTSFSAPLVAGTVALMLSARPGLTPAELRSFLRATAREFPSTGANNGSDPTPVKQCVAPTEQAQDQCYCTTTTCGAGMLDAGAAVQRVAQGVAAMITVDSSNPTAGQPLTLRGTDSLAITGRTIDTFLWSIVNNGGIVTTLASTSGSTASLTPSAAGQFSVSLTVTDSTGAQATSTRNIVIASRPPSSSSGGGALSAGWLALLLGAVLALARRRD